ncbi:hypothetical protein FB446DRAFT_492605 [Lentinula raphanica]|nr:hypothetical protein FB446DRAFT_492605 [Lentinula raphanica]
MRREDKDRYRGVAEGAMIKHPPLWDHSDSLSSTLISTPVSNTPATADAQHALFYTLPPTISPLSSYRLPPALPSTVSPLSSYHLPPALPLTPLPLPMSQTLFLLPSFSRSSSSCSFSYTLACSCPRSSSDAFTPLPPPPLPPYHLARPRSQRTWAQVHMSETASGVGAVTGRSFVCYS